jgi:hypothetical protein
MTLEEVGLLDKLAAGNRCWADHARMKRSPDYPVLEMIA